MTTRLFLTAEELHELTGFKLKDKQIAQLRTMGIAFRINGHGRPVVTRAAVEGASPAAQVIPQQPWRPAVLEGGKRAA